jgi:hypothetical protein
MILRSSSGEACTAAAPANNAIVAMPARIE